MQNKEYRHLRIKGGSVQELDAQLAKHTCDGWRVHTVIDGTLYLLERDFVAHEKEIESSSPTATILPIDAIELDEESYLGAETLRKLKEKEITFLPPAGVQPVPDEIRKTDTQLIEVLHDSSAIRTD